MLDAQKAIILGHPSYVWRFGQERRLDLVRRYVPLEKRRILDVGCGVGAYVSRFMQLSEATCGVDVDPDRVREAHRRGARDTLAASAERLPFRDAAFDLVYLNEVIEHVGDDRLTIQEACRVTREGGWVVIYAPNRLYPFETHGFYLGSRYVFGNIPLLNYLPDRLRRIFVPHARAYRAGDIRRLCADLPLASVIHTYVFPGFDGIAARWPRLAALLRAVLYFLEGTPLRIFGLSHFVVLRKGTVSVS